jgi:ATP-dependent DNA helicase PIF1
VACRKSDFSSKKCGRQRIESQDTTFLPGDLVSYKSIDTFCDATEAVNYPTEFLNSLDLPGMPSHNLQLKVGSPVILLRNLNLLRLYNGTRLVIKKLMKNVIEAIILNGEFRGKNIL